MGKKKTVIMDDSVQEEVKAEVSVEEKEVEKVEESQAEEPKKKILGANRGKILDINKEKAEKKPVIPGSVATPESRSAKVDSGQAGMTTPAKPRHSVKHREASEKVERSKNYPIDQAVELVKEVSISKFDGTLEIHINTNIKNLRGLVSLPFASGKKVTIIAFGKGAEESGADIVGDEEKLKNIEKGKINFDVLITTAEWMPRLARMAKVLGPRGLMPNPKNGTVTDNLKKAVEELQSGKVEYKTEKVGGVMHLGLGKLSQPNEELSQNIKTLLSAIGKGKIKKAVVSPTMGPGVKLDISSI